MGVFLSGPIIAELTAASQAADPLASGRRILEVVVPLCYRPALKVGHSASSRPTSTLRAMRSVLSVPSCLRESGFRLGASSPTPD